MKVLLIGGAPNTGKSNAVTMCANYLLNKNFKVIDCIDGNGKKIAIPKIATRANPSTDFRAVLKGVDINKKPVTVVIMSASDMVSTIDCNFDYLLNVEADIYISSIRDIGSERDYLLSKFRLNVDNKMTFEFPLAKMSRKNDNWYAAKKWYDNAVQDMLKNILRMKPFEI